MRYRDEFTIGTIKSRHILSDNDLSEGELTNLLELAARVKDKPRAFWDRLKYRSVLWAREMPSYRTDVSIAFAVLQMDGVVHTHHGTLDEREPVEDMAGPLRGWGVDVALIRTYDHSYLKRISQHTKTRVVNGLSNLYHPLQAIADVFTLQEAFGGFSGLRVAFVGDFNNVSTSLMLTCAKLGIGFSIATPRNHAPKPKIWQKAETLARKNRSYLSHTFRPMDAVQGANAIYTDAIFSMGQEKEQAQRKIDFRGYQITRRLLKSTGIKHTRLMHCAPVHWGEEIAADLKHYPHSLITEQAENRMHVTKALLLMLTQGS
jgi:ornithine carbamoyltransferase